MKKILFLILIIYFLGILILYFDLPEQTIIDQGEIYFYSCYEYDCARIFIDLAQRTTKHKCAFYDLDEPRMVDYFKENDAGLILYEENNDYSLGKSIKINGLMHHKFCVFDEYITLTGSWNPTERGTEKNDNYVILISSKLVAKKYLQEFKRLEEKKTTGSENLKIKLSEVDLEICFSPNNNCDDLIIKEINGANDSIQMLAFSFTSQRIAESLVDAKNRGVNVKVLFEKTRISKYSAIHYLNKSDVGVFLDTNSYTMHEKLILIDNNTAILGSYNPSSSAESKNDENLLIIKNLKPHFKEAVLNETQRIFIIS